MLKTALGWAASGMGLDEFLRCRDVYGQIDYERGEYYYVKCHRCDLSWELVRIPDEYWEEARREAS